MVRRTLTLIAVACCLSACFAGYDSRWGATKRGQETRSKHATPEALRATPTAAAAAELRLVRVRAFVSARYAAQVSEEELEIAELLDDANEVLGPTLDIRLDLEGVQRWSGAHDGDLTAALQQLESVDAGDGVSFVVGFVGQSAAVELNFHRLGMAGLLGKHIVTRGMNDAAEYDAIQSEFNELDERSRRQLYRKRLQHKRASILLHEIGHSLGAPHVRDKATLMARLYSHKISRFSFDATQVMKIGLAQRLDPGATSDTEFAKSLIELLESTSAVWDETERNELLAVLRPRAAHTADTPPEGFDEARWKAMSIPHRARYRRAAHHEGLAEHQAAWDSAEPLFDALPNVYEVQDMRCRLAMRAGGDPGQVQAHCADFSRLEEQSRR